MQRQTVLIPTQPQPASGRRRKVEHSPCSQKAYNCSKDLNEEYNKFHKVHFEVNKESVNRSSLVDKLTHYLCVEAQ